jgi:hypothetical protein
MSISYSGLRNSRKVTLPSVEGFNTNLNIIKDPPKSITTRKIDRISDNIELTKLIDESGDRICEGINKFARGVNPMVSVSYSNIGSSLNSNISTNLASLPYKIVDNGAFRPPIIDPQKLQPLSRQNRITSHTITNPQIIDETKVSRGQPTNNELLRAIKQGELMHIPIQPSVQKTILTNGQHDLNIDSHIQKNNILTSSGSGSRTLNRTKLENITPLNVLKENKNVMVQTNPSSKKSFGKMLSDNISNMQYIKDVSTHSIMSNPSRIQNTTDVGKWDISIKHKDVNNFSVNAPISKMSNIEYLHKDIELSRNLPEYNLMTNASSDFYKQGEMGTVKNDKITLKPRVFANKTMIGDATSNQCKNAKLKYKISPTEGYTGTVSKPMICMENAVPKNQIGKNKQTELSHFYQGRFH